MNSQPHRIADDLEGDALVEFLHAENMACLERRLEAEARMDAADAARTTQEDA